MKKNPWRFVFLAMAVVSGGWLAFYGAVMLWAKGIGGSSAILTQSEAASLGIIGGADGPTAVIIATTNGPDWDLILVGGLFVISLAGLWMMRKKRK